MKNIILMVFVAILSLPVKADCNGSVEYCSYKYEREKQRRFLGAYIGRGLYIYRYGGSGYSNITLSNQTDITPE